MIKSSKNINDWIPLLLRVWSNAPLVEATYEQLPVATSN